MKSADDHLAVLQDKVGLYVEALDNVDYLLKDATPSETEDLKSLKNKLEYKTNVTFSQMGDYDLTVQQAMRKTREVEGLEYLNGITDVGVQIEKAD